MFALKQYAEKGAGLVALVDIQPGEDGREGPLRVQLFGLFQKSCCCPHRVLYWTATDSWKFLRPPKKSPTVNLAIQECQIDVGDFLGGCLTHFQDSDCG